MNDELIRKSDVLNLLNNCTKRLAAFNPSEHLKVIGNIYDNPELLKGD